MKSNIINIFIGFDYRERAATNVLIDSLYMNASIPISITPLILSQLRNEGIFYRDRDPKQTTEFSFTRFLVPYLMNFKGWAIFLDCDMLAYGDIAELWKKRNDKYALICAKHNHNSTEDKKFLGEIQSSYPRKNWSSMMLFNCKKCKKLTVDYVNNASGLDLHRFRWLDNDSEIGEVEKYKWNYLLGIDRKNDERIFSKKPKLVHWTLGGPWFEKQSKSKDSFDEDWFIKRKKIIELWNED